MTWYENYSSKLCIVYLSPVFCYCISLGLKYHSEHFRLNKLATKGSQKLKFLTHISLKLSVCWNLYNHLKREESDIDPLIQLKPAVLLNVIIYISHRSMTQWTSLFVTACKLPQFLFPSSDNGHTTNQESILTCFEQEAKQPQTRSGNGADKSVCLPWIEKWPSTYSVH